MKNQIFQFVPRPKIQKATFDLSHSRKLSGKLGQLIPIFCQECVPGDTFNIRTESFIRLAPMTAPVMHKLNATIHYFFVPSRILWSKWEDFITGHEDETVPTINLSGQIPIGGLMDHMGIPPKDYEANAVLINALPFRAYTQIWNDYYRDQNFETEVAVDNIATDAGYDTATLRYRAWEKDYFTSALPYPQMGTLIGNTSVPAQVNYKNTLIKSDNSTAISAGDDVEIGSLVSGEPTTGRHFLKTTTNTNGMILENIQDVTIDVQELRMATRLQRWLERSMRSGSRYFEHLLAHWNIKSKDARLQRAEYIGGGRTPVIISDVPNTSATAEAPQASLAGNAYAVGNSNIAHKFCEEHGYIMGIMSVLPETAYQNGINRMYDKLLPLDFYFPEFAQLGEQEVKKQEIFVEGTVSGSAHNADTFGYQSRYAEYKYIPSSVHGEFRKTLNFWHMGRDFQACPDLNADFLHADKISDGVDPWRVFAVNADVEQMYVHLFHDVKATRPMPFLNDPTL